MLIIHPNDPTTSFLKVLYPAESNTILDERADNETIENAIFENDRIMILGHGSGYGLFAPSAETNDRFGRQIIGPSHAPLLKDKEIIGVWCHANQYAIRFDLTGLFTGMVISEMEEAHDCFIDATETDILKGREKWAADFKDALKGDLSLVPLKMKERPRNYTIDAINYESFWYLENGVEKE